jgi:glutathione S-transferase
MGTVPALSVDDKVLVENGSILRFLGNTEPKLFGLYPKDIFERHAVDAALDFSGTSLRPAFIESFVLIRDQIMRR